MTADSSKTERYNAGEAEARWQKLWDERGIYAAANDGPQKNWIGRSEGLPIRFTFNPLHLAAP